MFTSITSEFDKVSLECPITDLEIQQVLNEANMSSSPGIDNLPMSVIKFFWSLLKDIFLKAFNVMFNKGELFDTMKLSKLRLIPKKGSDLSKIKNWRPIGIETAPAKIFSGVINNRFKCVIDKITHRSQKAYSETYLIQENLLNFYELLTKSNNCNVPLATLILDFSKAFDSLAHSYIEDALKFHNFGPRFIALVMTSLNNRRSCIITNSGVTDFFDTVIGVLQGDISSPNIFKVCANPLLLKFCVSIIIKIPPEMPYNFNVNLNKVDISSGFADDINNFLEPTAIALQECYNILNKFSQTSNLKINANKTKIVFTGGIPTLDFITKANELGFSFSNDFTVLGLSLNKYLSNTDQMWDTILNKVCKIRNFWNLFHLTIPGRVNVIKTYFYSQLSYLGAIFTPPPKFLADFETCIISFLKQGGRIAKDRIFSKCEEGGLGLPIPGDFLESLKIKVFIKGTNSTDSWGLELRSFMLKDSLPLSIPINRVNNNYNPILYNLIKAFLRFAEFFWKFAGNILSARIFYNFMFLDNNNQCLESSFFTINSWTRFEQLILNLKLGDLINPNCTIIDYNSFRNNTNIHITPNEFIRLCHVLRKYINRFKSKKTLDIQDIDILLLKPNVKSRDFRIFFDNTSFKLKNCKPSKTRYLWLNENFDYEREKKFINVWKFSFLPMNIRDFSFKYVNNLLYLNAQLAHFSNSVTNPACSQCTRSLILPAPKESILHFFMHCNPNICVLDNYFHEFLSHVELNWDPSFTILGAPNGIPFYAALIINTEIILANWFIFQCRAKKKQPLLINLSWNLNSYRNIFRTFPKYNNAWIKWLK